MNYMRNASLEDFMNHTEQNLPTLRLLSPKSEYQAFIFLNFEKAVAKYKFILIDACTVIQGMKTTLFMALNLWSYVTVGR